MRHAAGLCAAVAVVAGILASPVAALGQWNDSGAGGASGTATVMPTGNTPAAQVAGSSVTLQWTAARLPTGAAVQGYVITRYDSNGTAHAVGSGCSGVITTTTCTETNVPAGQWSYTDRPVLNNWNGGESIKATVTV